LVLDHSGSAHLPSLLRGAETPDGMNALQSIDTRCGIPQACCWREAMSEQKPEQGKVTRIHQYIQSLCGIYSRVARKLGVDRSYVSRVARGERHSEKVETALNKEFEQIEGREA
jgi:hypothetical protein